MQSDVEMAGADRDSLHDIDSRASPSSSPATRHSPILIVDESSVPASPQPLHDAPPSSTGRSSSGVEEGASTVADGEKKKSKASRPPSTAGAKPKSRGPGRSPSPSPPPPPARPPVQTIRLNIELGGPDKYEVNIASLSKESGQRPSTPEPAAIQRHDTSDESHSEGDDEGEAKPQPKKRRKKKNAAQEYYDVTDPFIDDSELAVDERTFFAQTKQQGFYVSSGQVALLTDKTAPVKKPKSRKVNILAPAASISAALSSAPLPPSLAPLSISNKIKPENGSRDSPIALYSDAEDVKGGSSASASASALKRKNSEGGESVSVNGGASAAGGSKKKRKVAVQPFSAELESAIDTLKDAIAREDWDVKGKFPPGLKPLLTQVALKAIILGEYDDNFFNLMPTIFPYNRFTMFKLIKRTVWRQHTDLLLERQNALIEDLRKLADEGFSKAQEEWERSVLLWEKRQALMKEGGLSVEGTPVPGGGAGAGAGAADEAGNDTGMELDEPGQNSSAAGGKGPVSKDAHPPQKKYKLTDQMKAIIWQLVCMSNECCRLENEKNQLEHNDQIVSDQGLRKTLYQKIVAAFPDGWLSSGQISREVSVMKKKYEKEVAENE